MPAERAPNGNRAAITVCVILATLMQALDTTIANVALPYMQGSVSASQDQIAWVLTSYIVAAAIMTPPTGYLAGRFGLKRLFLVSVAGFTVASMLCGMAQSLVEIVLFRVLQGLFGAALSPVISVKPWSTHLAPGLTRIFQKPFAGLSARTPETDDRIATAITTPTQRCITPQ